MSKPIVVQSTVVAEYKRVEERYSYEDILEQFPDGDGSLVNPLVRRCQHLEAEIERLQAQVECEQCGKVGDDESRFCAECWNGLGEEIERLRKHERIIAALYEKSCYKCPAIAECGDLAFDPYNITSERFIDCLGAK